jgi:hypothetical protein
MPKGIVTALNNPTDLTYFEKGLMLLIELNFPNPKDFTIISERRRFRAREDEYIWKQNREDIPEVAEIYYKNEYLCDVVSKETPEQVLKKIKMLLKVKSSNKNNVSPTTARRLDKS